MDTMLPAGGIVVGVDGSEHSAATVAWAVELGRAVGRDVTLVHVWDVGMPTAPYGYVAPYTPQEAQVTARSIVEAALAPHAADGHVSGLAVEGNGWRTLVDASAVSWLLVVGVHHHSVARGVFGSFAGRVIAHARCASVVVPTAGATPPQRTDTDATAASAG